MQAVWQLDRLKFRDIVHEQTVGAADATVVNTPRVPRDRSRLVLAVGVLTSATLSNPTYYLAIAEQEFNGLAVPIASNRISITGSFFVPWGMAIPPFFMKPDETILFEATAGGAGHVWTIRQRFIEFDIRKTGPNQLEEIREVFPR